MDAGKVALGRLSVFYGWLPVVHARDGEASNTSTMLTLVESTSTNEPGHISGAVYLVDDYSKTLQFLISMTDPKNS